MAAMRCLRAAGTRSVTSRAGAARQPCRVVPAGGERPPSLLAARPRAASALAAAACAGGRWHQRRRSTTATCTTSSAGATDSVTKATNRWIEELRRAVDGLSREAASPVSCGGCLPTSRYFRWEVTYEGVRIPLAWHGFGEFPAAAYEALPVAAYGRGTGTEVNPAVRSARQVKVEELGAGAVTEDVAGYLKLIQQEVHLKLHPFCEVELRPYAVNFYGPGDHFQPHVDSLLEPGPGEGQMLGSVLLVMPNECEGGNFSVGDMTYAPSDELVSWVAFYGDVRHEVQRVRRGIRVALACAMFAGRRPAAAPEVGGFHEAALANALRCAVADPEFLPEGGLLRLACKHKYGNRALYGADEPGNGASFGLQPLSSEALQSVLKGRDASVARADAAAGLDVHVVPTYAMFYPHPDCENHDVRPPEIGYMRRIVGSEELERAAHNNKTLVGLVDDEIWPSWREKEAQRATKAELSRAHNLEDLDDFRRSFTLYGEQNDAEYEVLGNQGLFEHDVYVSAEMQLRLKR